MDKTNLSIRIAAEHYLTACRTEGKTAKTLRGYQEKLTRFLRWFDGTLGDFSIALVREYIAALQKAKKWDNHPYTPAGAGTLSAQGVANHVRVLKGFATWLFEEGYIPDNVLGRLAVPKAPRRLVEPLSEQEIEALLSCVDQNAANGARDVAILVLLLDTGLRLSELVSLKLADLHFDGQWLKVMGKGQKERIVPFGARCAKTLVRYITFFRPNNLPHPQAFLSIDDEPMTENTVKMLFGRLRQKSGIGKLHPHLLRNTFATSYLLAGGDPFTLQHILGHTTLEMTRRYVTLASAHITVQQHRFSPMDRVNVPALRTRRGGKDVGSQGSMAPKKTIRPLTTA